MAIHPLTRLRLWLRRPLRRLEFWVNEWRQHHVLDPLAVRVTSTCVECGAPYTVEVRWVAKSTDGYIKGIRGRCEKGHVHNCAISDLEAHARKKGGVE